MDTLFSRAQKGETDAFEEFVRQTQEKLYRFLYAHLRKHEYVKDLVQDSYMRAFNNLHSYKGDAAPYTWLCAIALNCLREHYKKMRLRRWLSLDVELFSVSIPFSHETPENIMQNKEKREALQDAIAALPEIQKTVLLLHDIEGLKHSEIAQILDCPEGTVYSHLHRARKKLRGILGEPE